MVRRAAEAAAVLALATIVTMVIAAPVLRAPSERVFGRETVGRHHDPFTVMEQFGRPLTLGVYSQPVTDVTGALLARVAGPIAAYNWLVLLSFPLSAVAAYLLARYLALSPAGATLAAMAYAFSPFHLSQAAYHPHVAQTQWIPLYLLALWWCLDVASPLAAALLAAATITVTLSNFYGGLIAAVITPIAVAAYWLVTCRSLPSSLRRLGITAGTLAALVAAGLAYARYAARVVVNPNAFAFPRADTFRYSADWWSYLMPPVEHPLLGPAAQQLQTALNVRQGMLEQQVSLGWGVVALACIALSWWVSRARRSGTQPASISRVPILVLVALAAFLCSLSPEWKIAGLTVVRPSAWLYEVVPMFRAYARFGVVVQLMAALLAGIGLDRLRRAGSTRARVAWVALVVLIVGEYAVSPSAMSRDVLPTAAHRWVVRANLSKVLDCAPLDQESASVPWLSGYRVSLLGGVITDCTEPNLAGKLAANGYTYLLVRRDADGPWFRDAPLPEGLQLTARFDDGQLFEVLTGAPAIYTAAMAGFSRREQDASWRWRWMDADAAWTIVNTTMQPAVASLSLELLSFAHARHLAVSLDGHAVQTLVVQPARGIHEIGPIVISPGTHALTFHPVEPATVADDVIHNGDGRALSFAIGTWTWIVQEDHR